MSSIEIVPNFIFTLQMPENHFKTCSLTILFKSQASSAISGLQEAVA